MPIHDTAGKDRTDLQWELERFQGNQYANNIDFYAQLGELRTGLQRVQLMQAAWGVLMILVSTCSLAVLLYAIFT